jgi:hypothetical protein
MIRRYKWRQKILWVCWKQYKQLRSDFKRSGFYKKIRVFYKYYVLISNFVCVRNQTIVAFIGFSKSYSRNFMASFILSNHDFYFQNCQFRALFDNSQPIRSKFEKVLFIRSSSPFGLDKFRKWRFWHFHRKNLISKLLKNTLFRTIDQIADPCGKNWKIQLIFTKIQTIFRILTKFQNFLI